MKQAGQLLLETESLKQFSGANARCLSFRNLRVGNMKFCEQAMICLS